MSKTEGRVKTEMSKSRRAVNLFIMGLLYIYDYYKNHCLGGLGRGGMGSEGNLI